MKNTQQNKFPELLTIKDVSTLLKCHPTTLRIWDKNGTLKALRIGKRKTRRYRREDVEKFIQKYDLIEEQTQNNTLVEFAPVGIFETDAKGDCLFVNKRWCELAGLTPEQALGQGWVQALHPEDKERVFREWYEAAKARKEFVSEYRFRTPKGKVTWLQGSGIALKSKGKVTGHLGTITDISEQKQTREKMEYYSHLLESLSEAVFSTDTKLTILSWNKIAEKIFNVTEKEAMGKSLDTFVDVEFIDTTRDDAIKQLMTKRTWSGEVIFVVRKSGKRIPALSTGSVVQDANEKHIGFVTTVLDITDRKQVQEKLKESESRFRTLADSSPVLMWVNGLKGCEFVNKVYLEFLGVQPDNVTKFDWAQFIHPGDRQMYVDKYLQAFKKHKIFEAQFRFLRADKQYRWMKSVGLPRFGTNGEFLGYVGSTFDITDLKQAEQETQKAAAMIESSDDAIFSLDTKGIITSWNKGAEHLYGYSKNEVLGKTTALLMPPNKKDDFPMIMKQLKRGKTIDHYETQRMTKDGLILEVAITISPIKNEAGQIIGASKIARDITERKKLEQRKDDFIALASHELKTPVTSLKMFSQALEQRFKKIGDLQSAKYLTTMNKQLDKLTELVNGLLDLSRVQQGKLEYRKNKFSVDDLIHETLQNIQRITDSHKIISDGQTRQKIVADKDRVGQVLINLINNAIKYSPDAKEVIISSKKVDSQVIISVKDFGMGIPKSEQKKIFDRFFQVNNPNAKTYPGLGLGLYISREIVTRHGGKIWLESKLNKGTTFYFSLPIAQTEEIKRSKITSK